MVLFLFCRQLTAHNWQKWKRTIVTCPCHKIYREGTIALKTCNYILKNYDFCEYVKLREISWKIDILSITAYWKFESKMRRISLWLTTTHHLSFLLNHQSRFSVQYRFPNFAFCSEKSPGLTQRSVSQQNAVKKSKTSKVLFCKTIDSNDSFILIENKFRF